MCDTNKCATGYTGRAILPAGTFAPNHYVQFHYILNHAISKPASLVSSIQSLRLFICVCYCLFMFFLKDLSVCVYRKSRSVITSTILRMRLRIFMSGFGAQKICLSLFARQRRWPSKFFCLSLVRFITGCFTFSMELSVIFSIISHSILMRCFWRAEENHSPPASVAQPTLPN